MSENSQITGKTFIAAGLIALGGVLFLWRFWSEGVEALGINFAVFYGAVLAFLIWTNRDKFVIKDPLWIIPIALIILSVGIYSTKFTGWITVVLLPPILFVFWLQAVQRDLRDNLWSRFFPLVLVNSVAKFVGEVVAVLRGGFVGVETVSKKSTRNRLNPETVRQVVFGTALLFVIAAFVIVPLLSGADERFARIFEKIPQWLGELLNFDVLVRILAAVLLAAILLASVRFGRRNLKLRILDSSQPETSDRHIVANIVLGGILALYLLFIALQIKSLFVGELPFDFKQTEYMVKTGFWQLFALTIINILFFVTVYRTGADSTRKILTAFTAAGLLLVISAGQRMWLYVLNYGLSYEKFFAFYTVLFCTGVFGWFLLLAFRRNREVKILRTLSFAALWLYALAVIIPLERIIFTTNLHLTQRADSRVNINELRMLGFDALPSVEKNWDKLLSEAKKDALAAREARKEPLKVIESFNYTQQELSDKQTEYSWKRHLAEVVYKSKNFGYLRIYSNGVSEPNRERKKWYEKSLMELLYRPKIKPLNSEELAELQRKAFQRERKFDILKDSESGIDTVEFYLWRVSPAGFSFKYPSNLRFDDNDRDELRKMYRNGYKVTMENKKSERLSLSFFFTAADPDSPYNKKALETLEKVKKDKASQIKLPNLDTRAWRVIFDKNPRKGKLLKAGILVELPQGILLVKSDNKIFFEKIANSSDEEYLKLLFSEARFRQVVESISSIPVREPGKNNQSQSESSTNQ